MARKCKTIHHSMVFEDYISTNNDHNAGNPGYQQNAL